MSWSVPWPDDRDRACLEQNQEVRAFDHHHHADAVIGYGQPHPRIAQSGQDDAEQAVDHIQKTDKKRE